MSKICVLGSLNIDMSTSVDYFPHVGETIRLNSFDIFMGGKGANQAVALGKLSADIMMLGKLGDQFYGPEYMNILKENDVDNSCVEIVPNAVSYTHLLTHKLECLPDFSICKIRFNFTTI